MRDAEKGAEPGAVQALDVDGHESEPSVDLARLADVETGGKLVENKSSLGREGLETEGHDDSYGWEGAVCGTLLLTHWLLSCTSAPRLRGFAPGRMPTGQQ